MAQARAGFEPAEPSLSTGDGNDVPMYQAPSPGISPKL